MRGYHAYFLSISPTKGTQYRPPGVRALSLSHLPKREDTMVTVRTADDDEIPVDMTPYMEGGKLVKLTRRTKAALVEEMHVPFADEAAEAPKASRPSKFGADPSSEPIEIDDNCLKPDVPTEEYVL